MSSSEVDGKYLFVLQVLESYMSNNYSYDKLASNINCAKTILQGILQNKDDYIVKKFGIVVSNALENHKKVMKSYRSVRNDLYILDSIHLQIRTLLNCPGDNMLRLSKYQITALTILRLCIIFDGDLMAVSNRLGLSIDSIVSYLSSPFLEQIVSKDVLKFLHSTLNNSFLYTGYFPRQRKEYMVFLFDHFFLMNGSLKKLSKNTGLSIPVLRKILSDNGNMLLAGRNEDREWIVNCLKEQEYLLDNLQAAVEDKILLERNNLKDTGNALGISKYSVRKLVKEDIPKKNPVRSILINGVLSTLDS